MSDVPPPLSSLSLHWPPTGAFGFPIPVYLKLDKQQQPNRRNRVSHCLSFQWLLVSNQPVSRWKRSHWLITRTFEKWVCSTKKSDDGRLKYRWRMYATNERKWHSSCPAWWRTFESHYTTNLACPGLIWSQQIDPSVCNCIISLLVIRTHIHSVRVCLTLKNKINERN